jgi:hypothetical protein
MTETGGSAMPDKGEIVGIKGIQQVMKENGKS